MDKAKVQVICPVNFQSLGNNKKAKVDEKERVNPAESSTYHEHIAKGPRGAYSIDSGLFSVVGVINFFK